MKLGPPRLPPASPMGFMDFLAVVNNNIDVLKQFASKSVEKNLKNRRGESGVDHDPAVDKNHRLGSILVTRLPFHPRVDFARKKCFLAKSGEFLPWNARKTSLERK